ncbi:alpha-amylase [Geomonas sp. Red276]
MTTTRPKRINDYKLPKTAQLHPSPTDWRDQVIYFLLPDRFSDGKETGAPLDRSKIAAARVAPEGGSWSWLNWADSGAGRWQGGTIKGVKSKISYLKELGATTIWLGPIFKQRRGLTTYHGYGIQDFLEVDPRFGTRQDLIEMVAAAHKEGMYVIMDIIFNHTGCNWVYPPNERKVGYTTGQYPFGAWLNKDNQPIKKIAGNEDAVWPAELQDPEAYTRAGTGDLGKGDIDDPYAENKRTDFEDLRDLDVIKDPVLTNLARCYKYWIAEADVDGFRIDTMKHVPLAQARNFCGAIKEFAEQVGKRDFFLVAEAAGGSFVQNRYLDILGRNLNAALDIGEMRSTLCDVGKGFAHPNAYFSQFNEWDDQMGSHRTFGSHHVSISDDHDHVFGDKLRISADCSVEHQAVVPTATQLFTLGIPCIYYGTEQGFTGPEKSERQWLPDWGKSDRYLREAMFGPKHPHKNCFEEVKKNCTDCSNCVDKTMPGFGPFGTSGAHCFNKKSATYVRMAALGLVRKEILALRRGRQYLRKISFLSNGYDFHGPGQIMAWSRVFDEQEAVCVVNQHGAESRGARIIVDAGLNPEGSSLVIKANTEEAAAKASGKAYGKPQYAVGKKLKVEREPDGTAYIEVYDLQPAEVLVLVNQA